jgi:rfaE bifunctional protein nucleotidyltransferase chain/domain
MSRLSFLKSKIVSISDANKKINAWKMQNQEIVFTNGCFDILHLGHITYLAKAADLGNKLVVALNTDQSVKKLNKGENRPINNQDARLTLIAALSFVDLVLLFNEDTPYETIIQLKPDVLVKGADYDPNTRDKSDTNHIVGSDFVLNQGGKITVIEIEEGFSTTKLIEKLKN